LELDILSNTSFSKDGDTTVSDVRKFYRYLIPLLRRELLELASVLI
jgi:hypothetical protein